jgi:hypothetical protein
MTPNAVPASDVVVVDTQRLRGFTPPLDHHNPDWTIAFREGSVRHCFAAERNSPLSSLELRVAEKAGPGAGKCFDALSVARGGDVRYDGVTDYSELIAFVT